MKIYHIHPDAVARMKMRQQMQAASTGHRNTEATRLNEGKAATVAGVDALRWSQANSRHLVGG